MNVCLNRQADLSQGFSLLELLATLAIVSLLIVMSYPLYTNYVLKTHRVHAETALLDLAGGLERYHATHQTYVGATLADAQVNPYTDDDRYQLEIANASENNYLVKAFPLGAQKEDNACGTLSLNQLGEKGISGSGQVTDCW